MKLAVTGKGGSGKTTVAAILARTLARRGVAVIAIDADPNPNLGLSLGLGEEEAAHIDGVVNVLLREKLAHQRQHETGGHDHDADTEEPCAPPPERTAEDILDEMGATAPDGVRMVETGRIERPSNGCLCCGSHATTRRLFTDVSGDGRIVIADLEAGVNDLIWAAPAAGDAVVVVTEPTAKSIEVARRAVAITRQLGVERVIVVANRVDDEADVGAVASAFPDLPLLVVPDDPAVAAADRAGTPPIDATPDAPAVIAVQRLAEDLLADAATSLAAPR